MVGKDAQVEPKNVKVFIVDRSLLLHDPKSILSFQDNIVVVPASVLDELINGGNGAAAYAQQAIRILDSLCEKESDLYHGVKTASGGLILVDHHGYVPRRFSLPDDAPYSSIISIALKWTLREEWTRKVKARGSEHDIVTVFSKNFHITAVSIVTKDVKLRVKAHGYDVSSEDYLKGRVVEPDSHLYSGIIHIPIDKGDFGDVSRLICNGGGLREDLKKMVSIPRVIPNQCCVFSAGDEERLSIYKESEGTPHFIHVPKPRPKPKEKEEKRQDIEPRNREQALALALLMDPAVEIVTLAGVAGSGKTLMALLAGIRQVDKKLYERIIVYRSNVEIGQPLGFLPGSLDEKFAPWKRPIHDLLRLFPRNSEPEVSKKKRSSDPKDPLLGRNIEIEPINFIQGRTLYKTYVIVDETQNFRPADLKKMITRVGEGTKIVLTGDIDQVENSYLDAMSNGLTYVIEKMKGQPLFGHVTFPRSVRSKLAEIAATVL